MSSLTPGARGNLAVICRSRLFARQIWAVLDAVAERALMPPYVRAAASAGKLPTVDAVGIGPHVACGASLRQLLAVGEL